MKSDVVRVKNSGEGMESALHTASATAAYRGLSKKSAIHLRLLAEEMLGMTRQITKGSEADFWIESKDMSFELHLIAYPVVTKKMRRELLKTSTSGKNEANKGFMGKIRGIIELALATEDMDDLAGYCASGLVAPGEMYTTDPMQFDATASMVTWSMNKYRTSVENESKKKGDAADEWDELEKSIVANIADEVKIAITGDKVEMIVYKTFKA